ncbi:MAG: sodium:solute symporter family protein, partial [Candidatus Eremiobacteraeota bacterium]|nr:sodium:solute symporter family protein [Candidatus Eremiobacteraeota bacterium]
MNASPATALTIVAAVVFGTMAFASIATRRFKMDLQQYIVGGRSFGTVLLWILLAGETYTTFAFLGIAGLSYAQGATAFFVLAYGACGYVIAYFFAPAVWRVGKERGLLTGPDFFEASYGSRGLGVAVAVLQFAMIVPYVALQLSGLQILLNMAGYGAYNATLGVCIAFILLSIFVFSTGLRGAAWASIVKDVLVFGAMLFAGVAIPIRFFGSPARMFDRLIRLHPHALTLDMSGGS